MTCCVPCSILTQPSPARSPVQNPREQQGLTSDGCECVYLRPLEFSHEVLASDEGGTHSLPPSLPQPWATFNVPSTEGGVQCHWGPSGVPDPPVPSLNPSCVFRHARVPSCVCSVMRVCNTHPRRAVSVPGVPMQTCSRDPWT